MAGDSKSTDVVVKSKKFCWAWSPVWGAALLRGDGAQQAMAVVQSIPSQQLCALGVAQTEPINAT